MDKSIGDYISSLSDADLLEYVKAGTQSYLPEAIAFAQAELSRRNLPPEKLIEAENQLRERDTALQAIAGEPLSWPNRVAAFIFGILGAPVVFPMWLRCRDDGEHRKARDMLLFGLAGFGFQIFLLLAYLIF